MSNKFNFAWQLVRVEARKIKDVGDKITYVMRYLAKQPNVHNYDRVHNWLRMTELGYKNNQQATKLFQAVRKKLEEEKASYSDTFDNESNLSDARTEDLQAVLSDLKDRKYGFQYATVPKAHTEFVKALETELASR